MKIAIVDYGAGNLRSVSQAIAKLGHSPVVTLSSRKVLEAEAVILPGVGAAAEAMKRLDESGLSAILRRVVAEGKPFFGVCLGLQLLFTSTEEGGNHRCLDIIPGTVKKLPPRLKVPHMGWNQVRQTKAHPLFEGIPQEANFYFVHSYYGLPQDSSIIAGETEYGIAFPSVIIQDNLVATQFHPEKSGELGLRLYGNFLKFGEKGVKK